MDMNAIDVEKIVKSNQGTIIDVRSIAEYKSGNAGKSINIPLQQIPEKLNEIKNLPQPIIVCCASGNRSGQARNFLIQHEITCYNGGSWLDINEYQQ